MGVFDTVEIAAMACQVANAYLEPLRKHVRQEASRILAEARDAVEAMAVYQAAKLKGEVAAAHQQMMLNHTSPSSRRIVTSPSNHNSVAAASNMSLLYSSHNPLPTSPLKKRGGGAASLGSPRNNPQRSIAVATTTPSSPASRGRSEWKCIPLKPPIPSKFQGDIEKGKHIQVPDIESLVNFPAYKFQKHPVRLPPGMRYCVMCGEACPYGNNNSTKTREGPKTPRQYHQQPPNQQEVLSAAAAGASPRSAKKIAADSGGSNNLNAIIPTQNKGLCTLCDINVWVVTATGLEIKWCKGCKNFKPWAAFGEKGLATKCLPCRDRQRERYAMQKVQVKGKHQVYLTNCL